MGKPRNVRNFWIDLDVDGRENSIGSGPVAKNGGFTATIKIRNNGEISNKTVEIQGFANDGDLILKAVYKVNGNYVDEVPLFSSIR